MKNIRLLTVCLLLIACLLLGACGSAASAPAATEAPASEAPAEAAPVEEAPAAEAPAEEETTLRILTLNGTTGFGMAELFTRIAAGDMPFSATFAVESDASNVAAALVNGDCDLAALPTNAAAALYNKTGGKVQVLALNTLGVLYLVSDGSVEIGSFADLEGQTVYAPAQNPSFIFSYLCQANGVNVTVDNSYAQPAELNAAAAAGEVALAVLPEPMVTIARSQNEKLCVALDLTAEWDKVAEPGSLVQGCVAVRRDFAETYPELLRQFLNEYEASIGLLSTDPAAAAAKIAETGIFAKAAVAEKAIPNCNVCFIAGEEMHRQLSAFLAIMAETAPQSIGGALPGDDFYCVLG